MRKSLILIGDYVDLRVRSPLWNNYGKEEKDILFVSRSDKTEIYFRENRGVSIKT